VSGYIKLHRGWRDTDGIAPSEVFSEAEAWLWLLENCAWKATTRWNGKGQEVPIMPGQIHVSLRSLASAWGWSKSKVERFLDRLERVKKAGRLAGQSGIVLTIENWAKYQLNDSDIGTVSETVAGRSRDRQEEGKEGKKKRNIIKGDDFVLPAWVPADRWEAYVEMRRTIKKPMTDRAKALAVGELQRLRSEGQNVGAVLDQSTFKSWQGLFPVKTVEAQIKVGI
jgi:hypothetical protein